MTGLSLTRSTIQEMKQSIAQVVLGQVRQGLKAALRVHSDPVGFGRYLHRFHTGSVEEAEGAGRAIC